jgi:hypothetical protein
LISQTYYEALGIPEDAPLSEIKAAHRKLVRKWHPDVNPDAKKVAEEHFKEIQEAYEVLGDPQRRQRYDAGLLTNRQRRFSRASRPGAGATPASSRKKRAAGSPAASASQQQASGRRFEAFSSFAPGLSRFFEKATRIVATLFIVLVHLTIIMLGAIFRPRTPLVSLFIRVVVVLIAVRVLIFCVAEYPHMIWDLWQQYSPVR